MVVVFAALTYVLSHFAGIARILFTLFFFLVVFAGSELVGAAFLPFPDDAFFALGVIALLLALPAVLTHDLAVGLGLAGVAAALGLSLTPSIALIILVLFSLYDIIAVYRTRHMVRMARTMLASGVVFGFIIPSRWRDFFAGSRSAEPGERFMILGSGDIGLPLVFAASIIPVSPASAVVVAVSAVIGLFTTHLLFTNQYRRRAMAALPPIVTWCAIGYLVATFVIH